MRVLHTKPISRYMKMKNLFRSSLIVSLSILSAGFLHSALATTAAAELGRAGIDTDVTKTLEPLPEHTNTTRHIVDALSSRHYVDTVLDDALSSKIFDGYINGLDPSRSYFLASDIESFEYLRFEMDNALRKGDVSAAFEIFNTYQARVVTRFEKVVSNLELGVDQFDFTIDEELMLDREEEAWAQNGDVSLLPWACQSVRSRPVSRLLPKFRTGSVGCLILRLACLCCL